MRIIALNARDLKALSSGVRINILKKLNTGSKTLRNLSEELNLPKSTVHENLAVLVESGFVEKVNVGNKWVHYRLTEKGKAILSGTKVVLILSLAILNCTAGIAEIYISLRSSHAGGNLKGTSFSAQNAVFGLLLLLSGTLLLFYLFYSLFYSKYHNR